jgi:Mrp family chromosome partitioning ATPase
MSITEPRRVFEQTVIRSLAGQEPAAPDTGAATLLESKRSSQLPADIRQRLRDKLADETALPFELDAEFVKLFHAVDAARSGQQPYVLQFVAATSGEGTSTVASGFAVAAALEYHSPVLILDCSPGSGPSVITALAESGSIEAAVEAVPGVRRLHRARLGCLPQRPLNLDGADMRVLLSILKESFSVIVLDCPAVGVPGDALALTRHCDGTVLVVRAERVRRQSVQWARQEIERFGGALIGAVVNARRKYVPEWLYRRS